MPVDDFRARALLAAARAGLAPDALAAIAVSLLSSESDEAALKAAYLIVSESLPVDVSSVAVNHVASVPLKAAGVISDEVKPDQINQVLKSHYSLEPQVDFRALLGRSYRDAWRLLQTAEASFERRPREYVEAIDDFNRYLILALAKKYRANPRPSLLDPWPYLETPSIKEHFPALASVCRVIHNLRQGLERRREGRVPKKTEFQIRDEVFRRAKLAYTDFAQNIKVKRKRPNKKQSIAEPSKDLQLPPAHPAPRVKTPTRLITVFISYSQNSPQHMSDARSLANRLNMDGIRATLDKDVPNPDEGWYRWIERQITKSDFVICMCNTEYFNRFEGDEEEGVGRGVKYEGKCIRAYIYENDSKNARIIPVLMPPDGGADNIPLVLKDASRYTLASGADYLELYRCLTNDPNSVPPSLSNQEWAVPKRTEVMRWADEAVEKGPTPTS